MYKILLLLGSFLLSVTGISQENITLTYIGNTGVYITDNISAVLIDRLHIKYDDAYLFPSSTLVHKITAQLQPDVLLFTHYHRDHYQKESFNTKGINITGVKINYAEKRHVKVEKAGAIIRINNKNVLYEGDTNPMEKTHLFDQLQFQNESIDTAMLPYWMLLEQNTAESIKKYINPARAIATHISPHIKKEEMQALKGHFPKVDFLTQLEQQIQL